MDVGLVRALPASRPDGIRAADDPVGLGRFERRATSIGPVFAMRDEGRDVAAP